MNSKNTFNKETMKDCQKKKQFAQLATEAMVASVVAPAVTDVLDMEEKTVHAAGEYTDKFAGGDGTKDNPYLISNAKELNQIKNVDASSVKVAEGVYFKLTQNITMLKSSWTLIPNFAGHFDGGGYEIDGLFINLPTTDNVGLFGQTKSGSTISNVGLTNVSVTGGNNTGGLVGYSESSISNSYATGSVTGGDSTGGLVGCSESSISNSYATGNVTGGDSTGGLVGYSESSISNSYATGNVTGGDSTGGLVGTSQSPITNAYATGSVTGEEKTGGLVGHSYSSISNTYALNLSVSGTSNIGQVVGYNEKGSVIHSYAWEGMVRKRKRFDLKFRMY